MGHIDFGFVAYPDALGFYKTHAAYATAHDAASGTSDTTWKIGQELGFTIHRLAIIRSTSTIPDLATIDSASIICQIDPDDSDTDFDVVVVSGEDLEALYKTQNYGHLLAYVTSWGSVNTSEIDGYQLVIPLNALGLAAISKTGYTKLGIRSSKDISSTPPGGNEFITARAGGWAWELEVIYSGEPTVTTQAVSDIVSTTAIGNGNITDLGNDAVTQHGVCWDTNHNPNIYDDKTEEGPAAATGPFTSAITGLTSGVTYYVRAYAINSVGISYGNEVEFTTLAIPTVTTELATNVKEPSATLNGILDDDGGEACECRFQYGLTTDYGTNIAWQAGKETEDTFSQAIVELVGGNSYHFRTQARNSAGTANGNDRTLTTITPFVAKRAYALSREEL